MYQLNNSMRNVCIHTHKHTHMYMYTHIHTSIHMYSYTNTCVYTYIYIHTYLHTRVYTYIHTYIHMHTYKKFSCAVFFQSIPLISNELTPSQVYLRGCTFKVFHFQSFQGRKTKIPRYFVPVFILRNILIQNSSV